MMRKLLPIVFLLAGWVCFLSAQPEGDRLQAVALGPAVNSVADEWGPVLSPDEQMLFFVRDRHPQNMGPDNQADIWISYRQADGLWSRAVNAGTILNDRGPNQVINTSPSGRGLYLTATQMGTLVPAFSRRNKRTWDLPQPVTLPGNYQCESFFFSPDGKVLLFAARSGGFSLDLFVTFRRAEGDWQPAINLGPVINTAGDERQVFLAADGASLYFSSDGHPGQGGQDWWVSFRLDDSWTNWTTPLSLGAPVNTPEDDGPVFIPLSGETVFFSSKTPAGNLDLYQAPLPESLRPRRVTLLKGRILNGQAVAAQVIIQPLGEAGAWQQLEIDADGRYALLLPAGAEVSVFAGADGFFPVSEYINTAGGQQNELDAAQNMLVAREIDPSYFRRESELRDLQRHLRKLDDELRELNEERKARREALRQLHPPESFADPQLEALRHRYNNFVRRDTSRRDELRAKGPASYEQSSEEDLGEMKEKYRDYFEDAAERQGAYLWEKDTHLSPATTETETGLDLVGEAVQELEGGMTPEERRLLRQKEAELRARIEAGLSAPGRDQPEAEHNRSADWEMKLEEDILFSSGAPGGHPDEIRFKESMKQALQDDLFYATKEDRREELRSEYAEKRQRQLAVEEKLVERGIPAAQEQADKSPGQSNLRQKDLKLVLLEAGAVIPLNNIFFEADGAILKPASQVELDRLLSFLRQNGNLVVEIGAHTHGWMPHIRADRLSEERAAAVANYLLLRGISSERIEYRGYGKTQPLTTNDTEAGRRQNQRIEMKILR